MTSAVEDGASALRVAEITRHRSLDTVATYEAGVEAGSLGELLDDRGDRLRLEGISQNPSARRDAAERSNIPAPVSSVCGTAR